MTNGATPKRALSRTKVGLRRSQYVETVSALDTQVRKGSTKQTEWKNEKLKTGSPPPFMHKVQGSNPWQHTEYPLKGGFFLAGRVTMYFVTSGLRSLSMEPLKFPCTFRISVWISPKVNECHGSTLQGKRLERWTNLL